MSDDIKKKKKKKIQTAPKIHLITSAKKESPTGGFNLDINEGRCS